MNLIEQFRNETESFRMYGARFMLCAFILGDLVTDSNFPPSQGAVKNFHEWIMQADELHNEAEEELEENLVEDGVINFYKKPQDIGKLEITKRECFVTLVIYSNNVRALYETIIENPRLCNNPIVVFNVQQIGQAVLCKGHEAMGYWTAKMEERMRNRKNAKTKSTAVKQNEIIVKRMIENNNGKVDRQVLVRLMLATDRGERTVKNLVSRILDQEQPEKTPVFHDTADVT